LYVINAFIYELKGFGLKLVRYDVKNRQTRQIHLTCNTSTYHSPLCIKMNPNRRMTFLSAYVIKRNNLPMFICTVITMPLLVSCHNKSQFNKLLLLYYYRVLLYLNKLHSYKICLYLHLKQKINKIFC
jgi:hypothetical protein